MTTIHLRNSKQIENITPSFGKTVDWGTHNYEILCIRSSSKFQHTSSDTTGVAVFHPLLSCPIEFLSALRTSLCQPYSHNQTHNSKGEYWSLTFLLLNDDNSHNH